MPMQIKKAKVVAPIESSVFTNVLKEVSLKQANLEATFQLILESCEGNSTAKFLTEKFDELKNVIKGVEQQASQMHDEHLNCLKNCDDECKTYDGCKSALAANDNKGGAYLIKMKNCDLEPFYAYCEDVLTGFDWMVIQRREDGSQKFYRNWYEYKKGFGDVFGEYWIGLDRLHAMTKCEKHELLIVMHDFHLSRVQVKYSDFAIGSEMEGYPLSVVFDKGFDEKFLTEQLENTTPNQEYKYSGNKNDFLTQQNGMKFTTFDRDNDRWNTTNCARYFRGAWWYDNCSYR